jgi:hypothetical protein
LSMVEYKEVEDGIRATISFSLEAHGIHPVKN